MQVLCAPVSYKNDSSMFLRLTFTLGRTEVFTLANVVLHNRVMRVNIELVILAFIWETLEIHFVTALLMGPAWSAMKILTDFIWIEQCLSSQFLIPVISFICGVKIWHCHDFLFGTACNCQQFWMVWSKTFLIFDFLFLTTLTSGMSIFLAITKLCCQIRRKR